MIPKETIQESMNGLEGWCTLEKACKLIELIYSSGTNCVVESGVFGGKSVIPMALAAKDLGIPIYAVDPWRKEDCLEGGNAPENDKWWSEVDLNAIYAGFLQGCARANVQDAVQIMRMTGHEASKLFGDGTIGFFHLDSNHSEEVSCQEVWDWGPKMRDCAIWVMDDAEWKSQAKAVEMIKGLGFEEIFKASDPEVGESYIVLERK